MDLKSFVSITGQGGLFKIISHAKNGLIVESLVDKKRIPAYANQKVLSLEDISIFCTDGDKPLKEVFKLMYSDTGGKPSLDPKTASPEALTDAILKVLPTFDKARVYTSDLKKLFNWYNLLVSNNVFKDFDKEEATTETENAQGKSKKTSEEKVEGSKGAKTKPKSVEKSAKPVKQAPKIAKVTGIRKTG